MQNIKQQQIARLGAKLNKLTLNDGIALLLFAPLFIILIIANWSNITLVSGTVIAVMLASLVIGLHNLANQFTAVIKKGSDTDFK